MTQTLFRASVVPAFLRRFTLCLAASVTVVSLDAQQTPINGLGKNYQIAASQGPGISQRVEFKLDRYTLDTFEEGGNTYSRVDCQGGVISNRQGFAELPFFHATLQLAEATKCRVVIKAESHVDIVLDHPIAPSKGVIYRNQDPSSIHRVIAPESLQGGWFPAAAADITEPFIFRDVRGVNVYFHPFQYDGATQTLRVTTSMVVEVVPEGPVLTRESKLPSKPVAEMKPVYQSLFLHSPTRGAERWSHEVGEVGEMLVVCTARDATAILPYVQWKREKGHKVKVVQVAVGTNAKDIIQQEYTANPSLLYVQLVGDWAEIKSDVGTNQRKAMDPTLGCVAGNDAYPELIIGRFSANTAEQVTDQVNKAITYEKNPDPSGTWYKKGLVMASSEGGSNGDDSETDIQHETYIRDERLFRTTYSNVASALGDSSPKSVVTNAISTGVSIINYTGHGTLNNWGTTDFSSDDVSALTNGNRLPVICSVACEVGSFQSDCFAEAWLRNPNGGAIAGMFSTIDQPWAPPMRGQDYFNDLLTGGYDYATRPGDGTSTTYGRSTFGSLAVNAAVLMYAESSQRDDLETIQTWTTFGDVSLQVRTNTPKAIALSNETVNPGSAFNTQVTADGVGVSGALVSLSRGEQVVSGFTDANGDITLEHGLNAGSAKLVVTGQNMATIDRTISVGQTDEDVTVTINQATAIANFGDTIQFDSSVTGTANTAVTWTCTNGTVSPSGLYSAPDAAGIYTVKATSVVDTTRFATATVTVTPKPVITVTISPTTATVYTGGTKLFTATASGGTDTSVTWSCTGGTITTNGFYTAPSAVDTYIVKATSNMDPTKSASATVTVMLEPVSVSINPTSTILIPGSTKQFSSSVSGSTSDTSVTWTCTAGTVSPSGCYTAPSEAGSYTVTATSNGDSSKSASASVYVLSIEANTLIESESNDSIATANEIPDTANKIVGYISTNTDKDYFKVLVDAGLALKVDMTGPAKDYDLFLYDSSGTQLKSSSGSSSTESVSYTNTGSVPAYYYIHVKGFSGTAFTTDAPYHLTLTKGIPPPMVTVTITPTTATLQTNTSKQFTATVSGSGSTNPLVTWTCTGGKVTSSGYYTAPGTTGTYSVTATSVDDKTKSASATVTVTRDNIVSVAISPAFVTVTIGNEQQFTATVSGSTDPSVTWSCTGGTVSNNGLYTPPNKSGVFIVKATSNDDTSKSASAVVTVNTINEVIYNETESNESISTANEVPDAVTKIVGYISTNTDIDYFKVLVGAGMTLKVDMTGPSGKDYDLYLHNSAGIQLAKSMSSSSTESLTYQNSGTTAEYYYIWVKGYYSSYSTELPYNLVLSR